MQLRNFSFRSIGDSNQKLRQKIDSWDFHNSSTNTETSHGWQRGIYGSINLKKFMKPSFAQPKNISEDQTSNPIFFFLNQASVHTSVLVN